MENSSTSKSKILTSTHKKKIKVYNPLLWTLDPNPEIAVKMLTDKYLMSSLKSGIQILLCNRLWFGGVRTKKAVEYWFAQERIESSLNRLFSGFDFQNHTLLKITNFKHKTTKWARKCKLYMKFTEEFIWNCALEYERRSSHTYVDYDLIEFLCQISPTSGFLPDSKVNKVIPEWKNLPPKYRQNDIFKGFKQFYAHKIGDPWEAYKSSKTDIPEFLIKNSFV